MRDCCVHAGQTKTRYWAGDVSGERRDRSARVGRLQPTRRGGVIDELHPEIEWHPWLQLQLGGAATVYRGHEGVRKGIRELEEAFSEIQAEQTEIRDLGERVVAIGQLRGRGNESGAITESAIAWIVEFKSGKVIRVREYLDPKKALEAVGLSE